MTLVLLLPIGHRSKGQFLNNFDPVAGYAVRLLKLRRIKVSKRIPLVGAALNEVKAIYRQVDLMLSEVSRYLPEFKR